MKRYLQRLFPAHMCMRLLYLGFSVLAGITLSACQPVSRPTTQRSANPPITLEFWTLQLDAFQSTLQPMFLTFEREHPNVRIHWVDIPFSEGPKRTLTALMSGHPPDVVNLNPDFSALLASRNALVHMEQALPPAVQQSYLPVAWQAATLSGHTASPKSITFGVPWYITSSITLYNKALLHQAGYQNPPATFHEVPAFAQRVHEKTGAYGLMPVVAERGNFLKELAKMGLPLFNEAGQAIFATPQAAQRLESYVHLYQRGWVPAESLTEGHQAAVGRFQAGTLATLAIGPNFLKIVKENAPAVYRETGVAPQFPPNSPYQDFSMMVLAVPAQSTHPTEAVAFAAFITNEQNQLALAQAAPVLPSVTHALQHPYFSQTAKQPDPLMAQGRYLSAQQLLRAKTAFPLQPGQNAINEIVDYYVQLASLNKISPLAALQHAQQDINANLLLDTPTPTGPSPF